MELAWDYNSQDASGREVTNQQSSLTFTARSTHLTVRASVTVGLVGADTVQVVGRTGLLGFK